MSGAMKTKSAMGLKRRGEMWASRYEGECQRIREVELSL